MFIQDYGRWLELVSSKDEENWIPFDTLPLAELREAMIATEYERGERQGRCWITFGSNETMINRSNFVVNKIEDVPDAIFKALSSSRKFGGTFTSVGCLEKE
jgi:hypothetical protein